MKSRIRKLKEIYDGWSNYIFPTPEIEALAKDRAVICASCDFMVSGVCTQCGCPGLAKHRSPTSECPIGKWGRMIVEDISTDTPDVPMDMFKSSDDYLKHLNNGR